jgi:hypothetical protein
VCHVLGPAVPTPRINAGGANRFMYSIFGSLTGEYKLHVFEGTNILCENRNVHLCMGRKPNLKRRKQTNNFYFRATILLVVEDKWRVCKGELPAK